MFFSMHHDVCFAQVIHFFVLLERYLIIETLNIFSAKHMILKMHASAEVLAVSSELSVAFINVG